MAYNIFAYSPPPLPMLVETVGRALVLDPIEGMVCGATGTPTGQLDEDNDDLTSVGNPSQESLCSVFSPCKESDPAEDRSKQSMFSFRDTTEEEKEAARELLIFNHPFKKVRSVVSKAALMKKNAVNGVDFDATDKEIREFLVALKAPPSCYSKKNREYLSCN
jgi:hypothetical protein